MKAAETGGNQAAVDSLKSEAKTYMLHPAEWYRFYDRILIYNTLSLEESILRLHKQQQRAADLLFATRKLNLQKRQQHKYLGRISSSLLQLPEFPENYIRLMKKGLACRK